MCTTLPHPRRGLLYSSYYCAHGHMSRSSHGCLLTTALATVRTNVGTTLHAQCVPVRTTHACVLVRVSILYLFCTVLSTNHNTHATRATRAARTTRATRAARTTRTTRHAPHAPRGTHHTHHVARTTRAARLRGTRHTHYTPTLVLYTTPTAHTIHTPTTHPHYTHHTHHTHYTHYTHHTHHTYYSSMKYPAFGYPGRYISSATLQCMPCSFS